MNDATVTLREALAETVGSHLKKSSDIDDYPNHDCRKSVDGDSVTSTLDLLVVVRLAHSKEPFDTHTNYKEDTDTSGDP